MHARRQVTWWKSGLIPPLGTYKSYWMDPFSLFWIEVIAVQFAELKRWVASMLWQIFGVWQILASRSAKMPRDPLACTLDHTVHSNVRRY